MNLDLRSNDSVTGTWELGVRPAQRFFPSVVRAHSVSLVLLQPWGFCSLPRATTGLCLCLEDEGMELLFRLQVDAGGLGASFSSMYSPLTSLVSKGGFLSSLAWPPIFLVDTQ